MVVIGCPDTFEILRRKGKWQSSLAKSAACRPYVEPDSRATCHLDESLGWDEEAFKAFVKLLAGPVTGLSQLVGAYRAHSSVYRDLLGRIQATDRLIDRIVYQLYGLTDDEIAIVQDKESLL